MAETTEEVKTGPAESGGFCPFSGRRSPRSHGSLISRKHRGNAASSLAFAAFLVALAGPSLLWAAEGAPSESGEKSGSKSSAADAEKPSKSQSEADVDSASVAAKKPMTLPKGIRVSEKEHQRLAKGEILVEVRNVEGFKVPEATVRGVIEAPPAQLWSLIDQCSEYVGVMPRISKAVELTRKGEEVRCSMRFSPPWPLSDMNSITRAIHRPGPSVWIRVWELESGDYHLNSGHWVLQNFDGDSQRTLLEYRLHSEPKVSVPRFLQEMGVKSALPDLIKTLRDEVRKRADL